LVELVFRNTKNDLVAAKEIDAKAFTAIADK
jgi:hypothetical protein